MGQLVLQNNIAQPDPAHIINLASLYLDKELVPGPVQPIIKTE